LLETYSCDLRLLRDLVNLAVQSVLVELVAEELESRSYCLATRLTLLSFVRENTDLLSALGTRTVQKAIALFTIKRQPVELVGEDVEATILDFGQTCHRICHCNSCR